MEVKNGKHLVISRGEGERVVIGDPSDPIGIIEIIKIRGSSSVRMSVLFSGAVQVNREEIAKLTTRYSDIIATKNSEILT